MIWAGFWRSSSIFERRRLISVSYTHLDVYKRQLLYEELDKGLGQEFDRSLYSMTEEPECIYTIIESEYTLSLIHIYSSFCGKVYTSICRYQLLNNICIRFPSYPVSYTHLDVYKRQPYK